MKLWKNKIRIFKGIGNSLVYHFGSITTRKKRDNLFTYNGSRGNKIFIKKWKISINFFEKFYLNSGLNKKNELVEKKLMSIKAHLYLKMEIMRVLTRNLTTAFTYALYKKKIKDS